MRKVMVGMTLMVSFALASCASMPPGMKPLSDEGLVAWWRFDEGSGAALRDCSGNGNHGTIKGAKWVKNGDGYALEFDGKDDHVDCGAGASLDLRKNVSMIAWVFPERYVRGEPGIVGKAYESYGITQYGEKVYTYISGGPHNTRGEMRSGKWHHVASIYDGKTLKIYVDGVFAAANDLDLKVAKGGHFWMARSDGELRYTQNAHFRGKITGVRVYNRVIQPEEIAHHARTTNITNTLDLFVTPIIWRDKVVVEVNKRGLGYIGRTEVNVKVSKLDPQGKPSPVARIEGSIMDFDARGDGVLNLKADALTPGEYQVVAFATKSWGRKVGTPAAARFTWGAMQQFPRGPKGARRLNNLVTELLNVTGPDTSGKTRAFTNPRKGWIYISSTGADRVQLSLEGSGRTQIIALAEKHGDANETMRVLDAGTYTISARPANQLIVRAIPELVYARFESNPIVKEFGSFQGEFQKKYILKNVNTFVGGSGGSQTWRKRTGGKLLSHGTVLRGTAEKPLTVDDAYNYIVNHSSFKTPNVDGMIADEFGGSDPICAIWAKAVDRALSDPKYKDKSYYPYSGNLWNGKEGQDFVAVLVKHDCKVAWERYLKEQRTETGACRFIQRMLVDSAQECREKCPGALPNVVITFGYFSAPPEFLNSFPHVNYRTYLDMQFNVAATHPVFDGLGGIMTYLANYADEETVRWGVKLFRHYGIEGNTEMLSKDPYILTHLDNPDFEQKGEGWTLQPAGENSITFGRWPGFGWLQGRYPTLIEGNTVLITRRSAKKPNVFTQEIKDLVPGGLYSFRMFTGDFNDLSVKQKHAVSIKLDGVEILNSFTHINANCYSHHHGPYDAKNKAWMNYHWRVFRAKGRTAKVTVSDWTSPEERGGPIGQELMYNYIMVQPYLEE